MKTVCKVLSFIGLLSLMVVGFAGLSALGAAETSPEVRIAHHNLAFTDEVCLLYAVEAEGTGGAAPFMEFRVGNDDLSTPDAVCRTYEYRPLEEGDGQNYYIFAFDGLNAAQMADTVYARAGVTVDGTIPTAFASMRQENSELWKAFPQPGIRLCGSCCSPCWNTEATRRSIWDTVPTVLQRIPI